MTTYRGSCHCGAVTFEFDGTLDALTTCTCSLCARRNALMHALPEADLRITGGRDSLTRYQFGTGTAEHFFCRTCGIYTHHRTRRRPDYFVVNAHCLEGVDVDSLPVTVFDGRNAF